MKTIKDWEEEVSKAESVWRDEKEKALHPFNMRAYVKATEKYQRSMRKATLLALTKEINPKPSVDDLVPDSMKEDW